ncbi:hypothetical protein CCMSSC00406_0010328 [Pleurotus cornucopiae]|uniref:Uncharacterized protein n=1 Tax=Pleurotus cornucopiae TaxID=5321 RepID=A0ACB7IPQ7_PLECO|nr:hypothetical protein CCMSSC00406_0010328 [Pleurotus cornucopiae]
MDASSALATKLDIILHIESDAPLLARKSKRHAPDDDDPIASDPEAVQVRQWRHRLQKTFLSARVAPKEEVRGCGLQSRAILTTAIHHIRKKPSES